MLKSVYITKTSHFLPNKPVQNDEMEEYLGKVKGLRSRAKALVLRSNGIKTRYYALDKNGNCTHTNAQIAAESIRKLVDETFSLNDIQLLTCGAATPDVQMPAHANMVQGELKCNPIDVMTPSGSCNSAIWGLNYALMSIQTGRVENAVCTGSELISPWMLARSFENEVDYLEKLGKNPYVAFDKEFLRWMLSDGAASLLLKDKPADDGISLKIEWVDIKSYSNELESCMYAGGIKGENGELIPWKFMDPEEWARHSVFALRQDTKVLEANIAKYGAVYLKEVMAKYNFNQYDVDYFLPHMSSNFFKSKIIDSMAEYNISFDEEKWFVNLPRVGNVGSASAFLMMDELFHSGCLEKGQKILVSIPESARFTYAFIFCTVV